MTDFSLAISLLVQNTLVLVRGESRFVSTEKGIKPLLKIVESGEDYSGYSAADKIVGSAAALLYIRLGVQNLYAEVISRPALSLLEKSGILVRYKTLTDNIINRQGDGLCPMEQAVAGIIDPDIALTAIQNKLAELQR